MMSVPRHRVGQFKDPYNVVGARWKARLKQSCMRRVRNGRERLISARRSNVQPAASVAKSLSAIIQSELASFSSSLPSHDGVAAMDCDDDDDNHAAPSASTTPAMDTDVAMASADSDAAMAVDEDSLSFNEYVDLMLSMHAELASLSSPEDDAVLEQLEAAHLQSLFAVLENAPAPEAPKPPQYDADSLLCPLCTQSCMSLRGGRYLSCSCGLRLQISSPVSSQGIRELCTSYQVRHAQSKCPGSAHFAASQAGFGTNGLYYVCNTCGAFELLLG